MVRVCRKVCLAQLLDACARLHPEEFATITPVTWWVGKSWPEQLGEHRAFCFAGAISFEDGVRITQACGEAMFAAWATRAPKRRYTNNFAFLQGAPR